MPLSIYRATATALVSAFCACAAGQAAAFSESCVDELQAVANAITADTTAFKSQVDRDNLLVKLNNADVKIQQAKYPDALDKLEYMSDRVAELAGAAKPKLNAAGAEAISNALTLQAVPCVTALLP